ncbi:hypothetical protein BU14_0022s0018 [Porphyra umbilicalis]|uniref:Uncharacterized protein n=1 Tax=Porphyra umbilicalis TaxID=2786 RepID=A0A1X6PKA7_PORUM|nr:hypothetical protein BU14_0022s0018 [Porphyra umbilicalis]|eukprot:OSX81297.1 hypothetical protein BU14_0022s0018 [Porphyra umbilicalis]
MCSRGSGTRSCSLDTNSQPSMSCRLSDASSLNGNVASQPGVDSTGALPWAPPAQPPPLARGPPPSPGALYPSTAGGRGAPPSPGAPGPPTAGGRGATAPSDAPDLPVAGGRGASTPPGGRAGRRQAGSRRREYPTGVPHGGARREQRVRATGWSRPPPRRVGGGGDVTAGGGSAGTGADVGWAGASRLVADIGAAEGADVVAAAVAAAAAAAADRVRERGEDGEAATGSAAGSVAVGWWAGQRGRSRYPPRGWARPAQAIGSPSSPAARQAQGRRWPTSRRPPPWSPTASRPTRQTRRGWSWSRPPAPPPPPRIAGPQTGPPRGAPASGREQRRWRGCTAGAHGAAAGRGRRRGDESTPEGTPAQRRDARRSRGSPRDGGKEGESDRGGRGGTAPPAAAGAVGGAPAAPQKRGGAPPSPSRRAAARRLGRAGWRGGPRRCRHSGRGGRVRRRHAPRGSHRRLAAMGPRGRGGAGRPGAGLAVDWIPPCLGGGSAQRQPRGRTACRQGRRPGPPSAARRRRRFEPTTYGL